jgi:O-antigen/teichoic acid export membrane protein
MKSLISTIFKKFYLLINVIYKRIFFEEISPEVEKFIGNITTVGLGTIIAAVFNFAFNILAARWLGPVEYGTFTLIQTVSNFLYIPMLLGFHSALVKYNSEKINFLRQKSIISTTYILVLIFTVISFIIYCLFSEELIAIFSISKVNFYFAITLAIMFVFYTLTKETLRSLHLIRNYSQLLFVQSIFLFASFLFFFFVLNVFSYKATLFSMLIAYGVIGGFSLVIIRKYLHVEFNREWAHILQKYSIFSLLGGISSILYQNIDKICINVFISVSFLGIYGAYNYAFTTIVYLGTSIFCTVFFPVASMCPDKKMLYNKIRKIIIPLIVIGWPITFVTGCIILKLYGEKYPFDLSLALLFATSGICISIDQLYGQLLNSGGINGVKVTSFGAIVLAIVNMILNFMLIPVIGMNGAVIATIIGYLFSIGIVVRYLRKSGYSS